MDRKYVEWIYCFYLEVEDEEGQRLVVAIGDEGVSYPESF